MEVIKLSKNSLGRAIDKAVDFLNKGGAIVCPTDTVYGLLADATNKNAVGKVFRIKRREGSKALPIFVKDTEAAKEFALIGEREEAILKEKWPGRFTFVLKKRSAKIYGAGKKTIALRIPDYKPINELLKKINKPLTGTSANISGHLASVKIGEVLSQFENEQMRPDLILDAGELQESKPSTIIDLTKNKVKILRP